MSDVSRREPGSLLELIQGRRVHVLDGAMGTLLYAKGVFVNVCYDELNLNDADLVESVHREYVQAGAELIETNTFGANPVKLASFGLETKTEEINRVAVAIARRAAGVRAHVLGAVGPLGIRIEPFGPTSRGESQTLFERQLTGLVDGGVDGIILETFSDLNELHQAFLAARKLSELPIFCQITIGEDGRTSYGTAPDAVAAEVTGWGAEVIGVNCSVGPAILLDAIDQMARVTDVPLSAQPNAGLPREVGDRKIYLASPEYMAQYARRMIEAGARFVGGCCGTTPEHTRRIRECVESAQPPASMDAPGPTKNITVDSSPQAPLAGRSEWGAKLARGDMVTAVEVLPPRGWESRELVTDAERIRDAGVDAVSVLDSNRSKSRMSAIPAALIIQDKVGIETVVHYRCRDRNMPSMISDLLGATAGGIRNVLLITGDPPPMGPYRDDTSVFDIDSIGLTNVVRGLNRGVDPGGNPIGEPTRFVVGVAVNQAALDPEREAGRFAWKVDAGADFAITQPVFDVEALERFLERTADRSIPIIAGLWPLTSLRNAEFLANEVPGVDVPEAVLKRMADAEARDGASAREEGIKIACEASNAVRGLVQGIHVTAPGGDVDAALRVVQAARSPA
ncbi:MAG: bifunctional homocysteine S-methyltransferase/methylenetetrahydrofolate reductase [Gemmatimonadota bacterium]|nr:MAG: bifunctional homocysteine S-methyltransferase/methylenetetrahydrofolate reductase [Gemmatimonadota bacterium]